MQANTVRSRIPPALQTTEDLEARAIAAGLLTKHEEACLKLGGKDQPVRVDIPGGFLKGVPTAEREAAVIRMLRHRQIPIKGSHKITGLRFGYLLVTRRHSHMSFEWWRKDPRPLDERNANPGNIETRVL